jgi:hypothetical protein
VGFRGRREQKHGDYLLGKECSDDKERHQGANSNSVGQGMNPNITGKKWRRGGGEAIKGADSGHNEAARTASNQCNNWNRRAK